jgi:hypothetical protein
MLTDDRDLIFRSSPAGSLGSGTVCGVVVYSSTGVCETASEQIADEMPTRPEAPESVCRGTEARGPRCDLPGYNLPFSQERTAMAQRGGGCKIISDAAALQVRFQVAASLQGMPTPLAPLPSSIGARRCFLPLFALPRLPNPVSLQHPSSQTVGGARGRPTASSADPSPRRCRRRRTYLHSSLVGMRVSGCHPAASFE